VRFTMKRRARPVRIVPAALVRPDMRTAQDTFTEDGRSYRVVVSLSHVPCRNSTSV